MCIEEIEYENKRLKTTIEVHAEVIGEENFSKSFVFQNILNKDKDQGSPRQKCKPQLMPVSFEAEV